MKTNYSLKWLCWASAVLGLVLYVLPAQAATGTPPSLMTYQGYLVDNNGAPLGTNAPKNFDVIFRIYTEQIGGTLLWAEQQTITIDKGYFSVLLGEGAPAGGPTGASLPGLFTGPTASDRYIEIVVKGIGPGPSDVTITPRLRFLASPYAFLAQTAVNAQNLINGTNGQVVNVSGGNVGINKTSPTSALDVNGTVTATTFAGSGSSLTSLNANNLSSGTVADARLSANVAKLNTAQIFTADNTFAENLQLGSHSNDPQHLQIGGGNSWGYLYGSYAKLGDGIHLGYNYYYDGTSGHLIRTGGATSRLSLGYGRIELATDGNDAPPSTRLVVDASGYVGIGTTSPGFPLNFANSLGDKISLYGNAGNHYGLGIQANALQIYTSGNSADVVFGHGESTNLTETFRIKGTGDFKVAGGAPIQIRQYAMPSVDNSNNSSSSLKETEYPTNAWSAAVVGWSLRANTKTDEGPFAVKAIKGLAGYGTNWIIQVCWYHQYQNLNSVTADVMFIRKELVSDTR